MIKRFLLASLGLVISLAAIAQIWEATRLGPQQWELTEFNGVHISWHQSEAEANENGQAWSLDNDLAAFRTIHTGTSWIATAEAQNMLILSHGSEPGEDITPPPPPGELIWADQGSTASLPFYPGLRGFGTQMQGGSTSSATYYTVTNTNAQGAGSFHAAMEQGCPKVIIFETSGRIDYEEAIYFQNACVGTTVACQTAPAPGILIEDMTIRSQGDNVVFWHCDFRVGDEVHDPETNPPNDRDSMQLGTIAGGDCNFLFLNSTFAWSTDGNIDVSTQGVGTCDVTIWQSLNTQGLFDSLHPSGPHSTGSIFGANDFKISMLRSVYAHNNGRNPLTRANDVMLGNNIMYNWGTWDGIRIGQKNSGTPVDLNIEHNLWLDGPDTPGGKFPITLDSGAFGNGWEAGSDLYEVNNASPTRTCVNHGCVDNDSADTGPFVGSRLPDAFPEGLVLEQFNDDTAGRLAFAQLIVENAGATPTRRIAGDISEDVLDLTNGHIINQLNSDTPVGSIIDSVTEAGGYPTMAVNAIDHATENENCPSSFFPASPNNVEASGYTEGQEWLILCADGVMPANYRPMTLTADP